MKSEIKIEPTIIVIFGATGDLTLRKLIPALYNLYLDNWIPEKFVILGLARKARSNEEFRKYLRDGVDQFSRRGKAKKSEWDKFANCITYVKGELADASTFANL